MQHHTVIRTEYLLDALSELEVGEEVVITPNPDLSDSYIISLYDVDYDAIRIISQYSLQ